ncbi:MAG: hypothetical protein GWO08_14045 [Gammaproteobacteria bacterium]|nr:hypothetical protein [Gammaproteobacteria bacterium]NIN63102.1 hypothetical protein [Gammaproteobacteria bacterium]NIO61540.1 hypothetical protein [Gammaproteobacteria bacterium]NIQ10973.1 hypothetical protein [Gammaproteobacteria bacterium]NIQ20719.1 hypothetical protein [Gammaproteobacteria bacterium]
MRKYLFKKIVNWLNEDIGESYHDVPLTGYDRMCEELRLGDVLLIEGRSRISRIIKTITISPWTHSAIYIGRIDEIKDGALQNKIAEHFTGGHNEMLLLESLLGMGTIVRPVSVYKEEHIRICRPKIASLEDRYKVIEFAVNQLGYDYDVRHILDLARFFFPFSILPRRWRSSLFNFHAKQPTRNVCSYLLAEAFGSIQYPVLPVVGREEDGSLKLFIRNTKLLTPKDFDYSPYFEIIKYPLFQIDELQSYRSLPWDEKETVFDSTQDINIKEKQES